MIIKGLTEIVGEKYVAAQEFVRLTYTNDFSVSPPKVPVAVVKWLDGRNNKNNAIC